MIKELPLPTMQACKRRQAIFETVMMTYKYR